MSKLRLSMACWNYDRTRALLEERIPIDGIDLTYINIPVEETFFRMIRHREFDVAEMSLSSYTLSMFRDPKPFVAIPVFPSRYFRHSCIFINRNSGIREPKDLDRKTRRQSGISADGLRVDSRHSERRIQSSGFQRHVSSRRRRNARPNRKANRLPPAGNPPGKYSRRQDALPNAARRRN